jgi:hypothetical protein
MATTLQIADWRIAEWEKTYAPLNVINEIEKMELWLKANPKRAKKKNWARFVINWLNKAHAQVVNAQVASRLYARVGTTQREAKDYSAEVADILNRYPDLKS